MFLGGNYMKTKYQSIANNDYMYDDSAKVYLASIVDHPLLTKEEEGEIATAIKAGDNEAKTRLISCNLKLVVHIAEKYRCSGLTFMDLVQEGNLGLMEAVDRFDPNKGRFSTYACKWIKCYILRAIKNKGNVIRKPFHMFSLINKLKQMEATLSNKIGRIPSDVELAEALGITVEQLNNVRKCSYETFSLNEPLCAEEKAEERMAIINDHNTPNPEDIVIEKITINELRDIIKSSLSTRELRIMAMRGCFDDYDKKTYREIGEELGLSYERVRQGYLSGQAKLSEHPIIKTYYR